MDAKTLRESALMFVGEAIAYGRLIEALRDKKRDAEETARHLRERAEKADA